MRALWLFTSRPNLSILAFPIRMNSSTSPADQFLFVPSMHNRLLSLKAIDELSQFSAPILGNFRTIECRSERHFTRIERQHGHFASWNPVCIYFHGEIIRWFTPQLLFASKTMKETDDSMLINGLSRFERISSKGFLLIIFRNQNRPIKIIEVPKAHDSLFKNTQGKPTKFGSRR
jgi:hypothetical protein